MAPGRAGAGAASRLGLSETPIVAAQTAPAVRTIPTATPAPGSAAAVCHTASTVYGDGTFEGQGISRRGGFRVAVTIHGGLLAGNLALATRRGVGSLLSRPRQAAARVR